MDLVCRSADDVDECWRRERWRLEVGVLRGVISSRDHERRTFHGPSLTSSNNRPINSFFGLHRRCALPSYWRIVPPRLPYFLKSSSVHLFSLSTTKFTSSLLHVYYLLDSIQYQYSVSVSTSSLRISFPLFFFPVFSIRNPQLHKYIHTVHFVHILFYTDDEFS